MKPPQLLSRWFSRVISVVGASRWGDRLMAILTQAAAGILLLVAATLVAVLTYQAWPALEHLRQWQILTSTNWDPERGAYGALLFVFGSCVTSVVALLIAVPLGVGAAVYLSEIAAPARRRLASFFLELLAAIPSVVFGFWAVEFLAKRLLGPFYDLWGWKHQSGEGLLAAGIVLAVMILPYVTALSYDACRSVPASLREGALALGATRWQTIRHVVLPVARPGILAAVLLALGRAVGETMAVTMVIGNAQYFDISPTATGDTIPSLIAKQLHETTPQEPRRAVLMALGLLLLALALVMNTAGRAVVRGRVQPRRRPLCAGFGQTSGNDDPAIRAEAACPIDHPLSQYVSSRWNHRIDQGMTAVLALCQWLTILPLFLILGYITWRGAGEVSWSFFTHLPHDQPPGLAHALYGSALLVALATLVAAPVGLLIAIFLHEQPHHPLSGVITRCAEWLTAVPSILIGVFGYVLLVSPPWTSRPWGYSAYAGAFALAVMMVPVVARSAQEALRAVPAHLREAALALGATRTQTLLAVLLPAAWPAILTGILLAAGRIFGETAPLILTARGSQFFPQSLSDPTPSLPFYIYDFAQKPDDVLQRLAWAGAFVLVIIVLCVNVASRFLSRSAHSTR
ncbi:MAG: phosphate ABC transporter permease subunit PstC [Gemmataceae bacterium]|nr:phosphate ABC transporter permease subunit PstC [Gemmataceae bacterium]